jgi:ABC-type antimicrobial peptide transport system permease subunit
LADGQTAATGTLVYLTLQDDDGVGSRGEATLLSAVVDDKGYWQANLGNARLDDGSGYFAYSTSGDELVIEAQDVTGSVYATIDTADDSPAPDMRLTTDPTSITVGAFSSTSSPFSLLGMALLALALTMLAGVLIARRRESS